MRLAASLVAVAAAWFVGGWVPTRLARAIGVLAGILGVLFVLVA